MSGEPCGINDRDFLKLDLHFDRIARRIRRTANFNSVLVNAGESIRIAGSTTWRTKRTNRRRIKAIRIQTSRLQVDVFRRTASHNTDQVMMKTRKTEVSTTKINHCRGILPCRSTVSAKYVYLANVMDGELTTWCLPIAMLW